MFADGGLFITHAVARQVAVAGQSSFMLIFTQNGASWTSKMQIGESQWHDLSYVNTTGLREASLGQAAFQYYVYC